MLLAPYVKYLVIGSVVIAAFFYVKSLQSDLKNVTKQYENEVKIHQETSNTLLAERLDTLAVNKMANEIEEKFNEISEENSKYRKCIANRSCYISLRKQVSSNKTATTSPGVNNELQKQFDAEVQRDLLDLRESIERDQVVIANFKKHVSTYCYKF